MIKVTNPNINNPNANIFINIKGSFSFFYINKGDIIIDESIYEKVGYGHGGNSIDMTLTIDIKSDLFNHLNSNKFNKIDYIMISDEQFTYTKMLGCWVHSIGNNNLRDNDRNILSEVIITSDRVEYEAESDDKVKVAMRNKFIDEII